jgi:predicted phage terminase large subunit-like protein
LTDLNLSLLPWQEEVWNDPRPNHVIAAGRRVGKTEFVAKRMLYRALTDGNTDLDIHRFYVAPTQGQARDVFWKKLHEVGGAVIKQSHVNNLEITLVNGQTISLKGADRPETMRGVKLADLVLDEYADMKPYVLEEILMPATLDLQAPITLIGTPMGRNHFYDFYKDKADGGDPDWGAWHYTSYDNPTLPTKVLAKFKTKMSSYAFRQEFMASFEAKGSEMFNESWVKYDKTEPEGDYYIAIDLAGFEDVSSKSKNKRLDDTAIAVVKVSASGWWVKEIISGRWDLNKTAEKIFNAVEKYRPVSIGIERGIAKQAVMSPLMDMMKRRNRFFRVEELTHGNKKKTDRIMWALQGRFENGYVTLNKGDWNGKFTDQLFQFPDSLTHDDLVDALSYVDQLQTVIYNTDIEIDDYEFMDATAGY